MLQVAPSTYYAAKHRPPSARSVRDGELKELIAVVHQDNYGVYGVRKVHRQLRRDGQQVAPLHGGPADARAGPARGAPRRLAADHGG